jgi:LysR family glycine cleavage system transcriptional activator
LLRRRSPIAGGMRRLPGRVNQRSISLSCAPLVAARWLLPRLRQYTELHHDVSINIDTDHRHVDFPSDGFDLAIRMGNGEWPHLKATLLFNATLLPVCAPDHFKEVALNGSVIDLRKTTTLHVTSASEDWGTWIKATGNSEMQFKGSLRFDTIQLAIEAAIAGLGTAIGRILFIQEELADGRLVRAGPPIKSKIGYWLIAPEARSRTEVSAFKSWLIEQSAETSTDMPSQSKQINS